VCAREFVERMGEFTIVYVTFSGRKVREYEFVKRCDVEKLRE